MSEANYFYAIRLVEIHDAIFRLGYDIAFNYDMVSTLWQYDVTKELQDLYDILFWPRLAMKDYGIM